MTMTLEQKVIKKAKAFHPENLKFKKGLAAVIKVVEEEASEYEANCYYSVKMYFKSKAAINRVGKALGTFNFDKKRALANFNRGIQSVDMHLEGMEFFMLEPGMNIQQQLIYQYMNHHTGQHYSVIIDPKKPLPEKDKDHDTGSTADGDSFAEYYQGVQESIVKGLYTYLN